MRVNLKDGSEVEIELGGRYADDIQIVSAEFTEEGKGRNVTDAELDWVAENYADAIYMEWLEGRISEADDWADAQRDRDMGL